MQHFLLAPSRQREWTWEHGPELPPELGLALQGPCTSLSPLKGGGDTWPSYLRLDSTLTIVTAGPTGPCLLGGKPSADTPTPALGNYGLTLEHSVAEVWTSLERRPSSYVWNRIRMNFF